MKKTKKKFTLREITGFIKCVEFFKKYFKKKLKLKDNLNDDKNKVNKIKSIIALCVCVAI